ncbi:hypothetical protein [Leptospira brenneri]|uniref:hypothetical protein n=1 Tax=Leptospira brenneri TaxID=2023182 RepID=UPI000C2AF639|nr:hypothetical protein [Leptospira brenneri]PJZ43678.1 hypothetical protein CH361_19305 [Leptospira brenneri]
MDEKEQKERMERINRQMHIDNRQIKDDVNLATWALIIPFFGLFTARNIVDKSTRVIAYVGCFANFMITVFPLVYEQWKHLN